MSKRTLFVAALCLLTVAMLASTMRLHLPYDTFYTFELKPWGGVLWPAVIMHASHNVFSTTFNRLTVPHQWTEYLTTEFGAGLAIIYVLVACWCYCHRDALRS